MAVGRSGEPSRLMVRLLSRIVGPFLGAAVLAEVEAVAGGALGLGGAGAFFLPFLATVAQDWAGAAGVAGGGGGCCCGAGRAVASGALGLGGGAGVEVAEA